MEDLKQYFETTKGLGVISTADSEGRVDAAIYAHPLVNDDGTVAFVMLDRLTHHNIQSNPHAAYLYKEDGPGYKGKRLFLTKVSENTDQEMIDRIISECNVPGMDTGEKIFVVVFKVDKVLPLIGAGK